MAETPNMVVQAPAPAYRPLPPDGCVLTTAETAMVLRMPEKTLEWWRRERRGPIPMRIGRHVRYRSEDVRTWLAQQAEAGEGWMAS